MAVSARGRANQSLYLGRILLAAWRRDLSAETVPASTLTSAYLPAIRDHLKAAYGWFLLEILRQEPLPAHPPGCCAELPPRPEGKVVPAEVREFEALEQTGWLAELLAETQDVGGLPRSPDNLLASATGAAGPEQVEKWSQSMQILFDRMGDSLDEY